jgi:hypothetical protein
MRLLRLSLFLPALAVMVATVVAGAQPAPALAGRWEGTLIPAVQRGSRDLHARSDRPKLPTVVIIRSAGDGTYSGTWASTSQAGITEIGGITTDGDTIRINVPNWVGFWEGTLSKDGSELKGKWTQNGLISPLVLKKTGTE